MKIDRSTPVPLHFQLRQMFLQQIDDGALKPGDQIPPETELAARLSISRTTIRQAIGSLVQEGVLTRQKAKGTFVCQRKIQRHLHLLTSFTEDMRTRGMQPDTRLLDIRLEEAEPVIAERLQVPAGEPVIRIERLRLADGAPIGTHCTWILPFAAFADVQADLAAGGSLYRLYEERTGRRITTAEETMEADAASAMLASLLGIKRGAPILQIERISQDETGAVMECVVMRYRADRYRYHTRLTR